MNQTQEASGASFMEKLSAFIVDKRSLIFLITIILLIFSAFSRNWVEVESDLTFYLPEDSETKQALNVMDEQFITYGTAKVMVANITQSEAAALEDTIKGIRGVQMVDYDETAGHYNNLSALYSITFAYPEDDDACLTSLDAVKEALSAYDLYVDTDLGNTQAEIIDHEISIIMIYVAVVIVVVLLLIGIVQAARSFSRALSKEDIISDLDERNTLVKFKSRSRAFGITQGVCFVLAVVFILLGAYHDYDGMTGIGLGFAFAISVSFFSELFSYFYYESKN